MDAFTHGSARLVWEGSKGWVRSWLFGLGSGCVGIGLGFVGCYGRDRTQLVLAEKFSENCTMFLVDLMCDLGS